MCVCVCPSVTMCMCVCVEGGGGGGRSVIRQNRCAAGECAAPGPPASAVPGQGSPGVGLRHLQRAEGDVWCGPSGRGRQSRVRHAIQRHALARWAVFSCYQGGRSKSRAVLCAVRGAGPSQGQSFVLSGGQVQVKGRPLCCQGGRSKSGQVPLCSICLKETVGVRVSGQIHLCSI